MQKKEDDLLGAAFASFWKLVEPIRNGLYGFILKSLDFSTDVDDVYQETLLNAFRYFRTYRRDKEFRPWLYAIAYNEIKRHFRKTRRRNSIVHIDLPLTSPFEEKAALVREVFRYAAGLKPREREIFFLFYESGFTIADIKGITGLKEGHIKLLLSDARNYLRKALGVTHE